MGTLGGFASPFGPHLPSPSSLASLGLAKPATLRCRQGRARSARGGQGGGPSRSPRRGQSRQAPHACLARTDIDLGQLVNNAG